MYVCVYVCVCVYDVLSSETGTALTKPLSRIRRSSGCRTMTTKGRLDYITLHTTHIKFS